MLLLYTEAAAEGMHGVFAFGGSDYEFLRFLTHVEDRSGISFCLKRTVPISSPYLAHVIKISCKQRCFHVK